MGTVFRLPFVVSKYLELMYNLASAFCPTRTARYLRNGEEETECAKI